MSIRHLGVILFTTFLTFCTLYTPQPILPQLVIEFDIAMTEATLLTTVTLIPLGLAPIFYGYFLQAVPAKLMLQGAVLLLIIDQIALFFASTFPVLLILRLLQGFLMPAIFTALMTYCANMSKPEDVRRIMGWYVAATIVGGFSSRALSGYLATYFGWQWIFLVLGIALLIPLWLCRSIPADATVNFARLDGKSILRIWKTPNYRFSYIALFTIFFAFTGILSMLPFRLTELMPDIDSFTISLVYLGYMIGIPAALLSNKLVSRLKSEQKVLFIGLILNIVGLIAYYSSNIILLFTMMLTLAAGLFLIHSTLSGYLNHNARKNTCHNTSDSEQETPIAKPKEHAGVVNGIYVSVYYISGTLGSWLPVLGYQYLGWNTVISLFLCILMIPTYYICKLRPDDQRPSIH